MTRVLTLLNQKNHYLEKFYSLNEEGLKNFLQGQFDDIENFYESREKILEMIKYIDSQLSKEETTLIGADPRALDSLRRNISESLRVKNIYVEQILKQDIEILSCIESTKNSIIKELQELQKGKKAIGGYKLRNHNKRLDEEI